MFYFKCKMHKIVHKFLLVGDKFMPEMHLRQPGFTYSACGLFSRNKELKSLCRQEMQIVFTKISLIRLVFNTIWPMANQKTKQKELNQTKF